MKKLIIILTALILIIPDVADARRKIKMAGEVDQDGVYTDAAYNFQFQINDEWSSNINKEKDNDRVVCVRKKYDIPMDYADAPDYTQVPRIVVFADTSSMPTLTFIDSLVSETYKTDQKKEILKQFEILSEQELIPKGRKPVSLGTVENELKGVQWLGQAKYMKEVATSASAAGGKRVYGSYGGAIVATKNGNTIVLFYMICEYQYFDSIFNEMIGMINTMRWME
ncbi:MAG: hypothetical protein ACOYVF_14615 [Candidatus Zixiibacteriota bacterium]